MTQVRVAEELKRHRAVDAKRSKWEEREARLLAQLKAASGQMELRGTPAPESTDHTDQPTHTPTRVPAEVALSRRSAVEVVRATEPESTPRSTGSSLVSAAAGTEPSIVAGHAMLANQVPPLAAFSGEEKDGITFGDWHEQFELVAGLCGWSDHVKFINVATRLKGVAYAFYRSCTATQRASYQQMVELLTDRFTPVQIQSVQSSLFHDRKQTNETVDEYAQDVRRLFYQAYPRAQQGTQETEAMGRSVLAYQFVAGLKPNLKSKLAGVEGTFDQLLVKARFEEAKLRDLSTQAAATTKAPTKDNLRKPYHTLTSAKPTNQPGVVASNEERARDKTGNRCYHCHGTGHFQKNCPLRGRAAPEESRGRNSGAGQKDMQRRVAALVADPDRDCQQKQERVMELRRALQEAEVDESLSEAVATMRVLKSAKGEDGTSLGPTLTADVEFEGSPVQALLDTGSPVTIVSMKFLLQALAKQKPKDQDPTEWAATVKARLEPPALMLHNYGGDELKIVRQLSVAISREGHTCTATVLVQKDAPLDLLLGTDLQTQLGFLFLQKRTDGMAIDLLQKGKWAITQTDHGPKEDHESHSSSEGCEPEEDNTLHAVDTTVQEPVSPVIHLIQAARLPSRHVKFVRARVLNPQAKGAALFEAQKGDLNEKGIVIEDAVVEPDDNRCVTLAVHNNSLHTVRLEEGHVLGCLQAATVLPTPSSTEGRPDEQGCTVKAVHPTSPLHKLDKNVNGDPDLDRMTRLLKQLDWDSPALTLEQKHQLKELLLQHGDLFALDSSEFEVTNVVQHTINTGDNPPIRQQARRIPFALHSKVDDMTEEMLEQGIIQPSQSPWASPIVLVAKKDGTTRFCVDYRKLNAVTKLDVFPLPRVDDSLDLLAKSKYFSTLDLASGYWQVEMAPESVEKTAFATHSGLYEFSVMPFGLCNAPATFQRLMETVLAGLSRDTCMVYLDDILVLGATLEEHLQNLAQVFNRLQEAGLRLKPTKCHLARREIEYLGFIVTDKGVAADPRKIEAVRAFPTPTDLKHLQSFQGLASYYRRFIPNFAKIANPLHALTRKDTPFLWSSDCEQAFENLKQSLTQASVLAFPNFD